MRLFLSFLFTTFLSISLASGQTTEVPKIFQLGEGEQFINTLTKDYSKTLLEACNNDMKAALGNWLEMMNEMDKYSEKINYDIKGVQVLFHVFWGVDGSIEHIGYLLQPDSKMVKEDEFKAFLSSFSKRYKLTITSDRKFKYYTNAAFPTFRERASD